MFSSGTLLGLATSILGFQVIYTCNERSTDKEEKEEAQILYSDWKNIILTILVHPRITSHSETNSLETEHFISIIDATVALIIPLLNIVSYVHATSNNKWRKNHGEGDLAIFHGNTDLIH